MFLSSSSLRASRVVGRFAPAISFANVWRPSYRPAAPAHVTPGSVIASPNRPDPCIPTPIMPKRTVSLGGTRPARSDVGARDAPTAAPLGSRNSRRDQVVFMVTSLSHALPRGEVDGRDAAALTPSERDHKGGGRTSGVV